MLECLYLERECQRIAQKVVWALVKIGIFFNTKLQALFRHTFMRNPKSIYVENTNLTKQMYQL